jgi:hypothetical protein
MDPVPGLQQSDCGVVARYLQVRTQLHDGPLTEVATLIESQYQVRPTRRIPATLIALVRGGFTRPGEGELWPVIFLGNVDITLALAAQISSERLSCLGTVIDGPHRIKHRHWEDWWGWEVSFGELPGPFYELSTADQQATMVTWFSNKLEWLARNGLLRRK